MNNTIEPQASLRPTILIQNAWNLYKRQFRTLVGISFVSFLVSILIVGALFLTGIGTFFSSNGIPVLLIIVASLYIIAMVFIQAWSQSALIYSIKDGVKFKESYRRGWKIILPYVGLSLLTALIVIGGFILVIIPGIIFAVWYGQAMFVMIDQNKKIKESLRESKALVKGKWWLVFGRIVILMAVYIVITVCVTELARLINPVFLPDLVQMIISIVATPFILAYFYFLYEGLKAAKAPTPVIE